ncbi:MAG TPA: PQQ-dependent sugar dehydrogenase, partial [Gemmatimonadaceae bacterium]|nr:PQQ-dependent sugar dehydrogenase [Gemmatimonadaceae bacterium]
AALLLAACSKSGNSTASASSAADASEAPQSSQAKASGDVSAFTVPKGFAVRAFATDLQGPRMMAFGPDKALYVSEPRAGKVMRLVDTNGDGQADTTTTALNGLNRPHGLAWRGDTLWVANTDAVIMAWSSKHDGNLDSIRTVVGGLPAGGRHWTKTIHFPPAKSGDVTHFFLATGSSCNVCEETDPLRATISRWTIDGKPAGASNLMNPTAAKKLVHNGGKYGEAVWAYGLRNSVDFGWEPSTGAMWATHNGGDQLGESNSAITDSVPPEEVVNIIREGGFYGWPYCYDGGKVNPIQPTATPAICKQQIAPALTDTAHSAPLGLVFYTGTQFPAEYRGNEFIAEHGSWNRSQPVGYRVIRVIVKNGKPERLEAFMTGWREAKGRPMGLVVGPDGTLFISDDAGGRIYSVRWNGSSAADN